MHQPKDGPSRLPFLPTDSRTKAVFAPRIRVADRLGSAGFKDSLAPCTRLAVAGMCRIHSVTFNTIKTAKPDRFLAQALPMKARSGLSVPQSRTYWTTRVFVDRADLYGEVLAARKPDALPEVRGIRRILDAEGVSRNGRVVDIACGIGRHIIPLAKLGYRAVGCDFSPGFIAQARDWAGRAHLDESRIRFYKTDYRFLDRTLRRARERPFDAAICIFTSMGHYGDEGDLATMRGVRRVVRPAGLFILEMGNRDWVLRHFEPRGVVRATKDLEIRERRRWDWESSTVHSMWAFYRGAGRRKRKVFEQEITVRLYSVHELKSLLERAGWEYLRSYGSLATLEPIALDVRRVVVVGRRPSS